MKNSKGETLKHPYLALAEMRRAQQNGVGDDINDPNCFDWYETTEEGSWWLKVYEGEYPAIPAASLAELEAWQKSKEQKGHDYKAMYGELCERYKALENEAELYRQSAYEPICKEITRLQEKYDENGYERSPMIKLQRLELHFDAIKKRTSTPAHNYVAECAMRLFGYGTATELSWDKAEKWAAEGRKRGHIN